MIARRNEERPPAAVALPAEALTPRLQPCVQSNVVMIKRRSRLICAAIDAFLHQFTQIRGSLYPIIDAAHYESLYNSAPYNFHSSFAGFRFRLSYLMYRWLSIPSCHSQITIRKDRLLIIVKKSLYTGNIIKNSL